MALHQIKLILLGLFAIFRKALCCFSRRRKPSLSEPVERLESINIVSHNTQTRTKHVERDWNSWDDSPRTVEEHIEQYRQRMAKSTSPQNEEHEPDFFNELTPVIQPQPKYYLEANENPTKTDFSRLAPITDVPIPIDPNLQDWEEDVPGGWEELDAEHTKQIIREKRKELRQQRQKSTKAQHRNDNLNVGQQFRHDFTMVRP